MTAPGSLSWEVRVRIGLDTETYLIDRGRLVPRCVCVQIGWLGEPPSAAVRDDPGYVDAAAWGLDGGALVVDRQRAVREVLPELLGQPQGGIEVVAHNAAYDLAEISQLHAEETGDDGVLRWVFGALHLGQIRDTAVRESLICVATGETEYRRSAGSKPEKTKYDLATLARRYLGIDIAESKTTPHAWRLRYRELDGVPVAQWPRAAVEYAAMDAVLPLAVLDAQDRAYPSTLQGYPTRDETGQIAGERRETAAAWALHLMAAWGPRTDPERVASTLGAWRAETERREAVAARHGWTGHGSKAALAASVTEAYTRRGLAVPMTPPSKTFPAGQVKTSADVLEESGDDDLVAFAEGASLTKSLAVWGEALEAGTIGPVTSRPNHLVETGRTSWSDPPYQQPPRVEGVRECHVPRPGYLYCSVDYDAIELCSLAQVCLWIGVGSTLAQEINAGRDPHLETAVALLAATGHPTDYDTALGRLRAGDAEIKQMRQVAKAPNFGLPGLLGAPGLVEYARTLYDVRLTLEDAETIYRVWHARRPEVRAYFGWIRDVLGDGVVQQFVSGRLRGDVRMTAACNGFFQGLTADGAKYAAWWLACAAYTGQIPDGPPELEGAAAAFYGSRPWLFLHDEILAEVPEDRAHEAAEAMGTIMRAAMALHMPDVRIGAEPALMRRWSKAAKTVRRNGRLIPWEDA